MSTKPVVESKQAPDCETASAANSVGSSNQIRNDDSNPQQATGGSRTLVSERGSLGSMTASTTSEKGLGSGRDASRRALSVPPFKKDPRKLFVGGLPADVTEAEFQMFFEQYGRLVDSVVMFDFDTQRSRGFGFVTFEDPEIAKSMLLLGHDSVDRNSSGPKTGRVQMRDKLIEIKSAEPKEGRGGCRFNSRRSHSESAWKPPVFHGSYDPQMMYPADVAIPPYPMGPPYYPMVPPYFSPGASGFPAPVSYPVSVALTSYPPYGDSFLTNHPLMEQGQGFVGSIPLGAVGALEFPTNAQLPNHGGTSAMQYVGNSISLRHSSQETLRHPCPGHPDTI